MTERSNEKDQTVGDVLATFVQRADPELANALRAAARCPACSHTHPDADCDCGCGDGEDDCQHEWELRSEHDLWVCAWCSAEVTSPPGATS